MLRNDIVDGDQSLMTGSSAGSREVEIPGALPVRLHTIDLARHVAITPEEKRYVVASFRDALGGGYLTAIYPQQNGYLTLLRLPVHELRSESIDQALQNHTTLVRVIQQGKLNNYLKGRE